MLPVRQFARLDFAIPPAGLRERVDGAGNETWFVESGARAIHDWQHVLRASGLCLADFPVILEHGCGCGRIMRHLVKGKAARQTIIGADTDGEAVAWLAASLPGTTPMLLPERPPSGLANSSVDLVLSPRAFSHHPEQEQFAWLAEFGRMIRPGGYLVAAINGQVVLDQYLDTLGVETGEGAGDDVRAAMQTLGFHHAATRTASFHSIAYIAREWLRWFDLIGWYPALTFEQQDLVVLRRGFASISNTMPILGPGSGAIG